MGTEPRNCDPLAGPLTGQHASASARFRIFLGAFLILLAVWKGEGGHKDRGEYLDSTVRLAFTGSMQREQPPLAFEEVADFAQEAELTLPELIDYTREQLRPDVPHTAPGFPVLAAPLAWVGAGVDWASDGAVGTRAVTALAPPLFGALACVILFEVGVTAGWGAAGAWAALVLALASPLASFSRLYYPEAAATALALLAVWALLRLQQRSASAAWALLCGGALAALVAVHYANVLMAGVLGFTALILTLADKRRTLSERWLRLRLLALLPLATVAALAWMNRGRYGSVFPAQSESGNDVGYSQDVASLAVSHVIHNLKYLGQWLLRVPWALPAFVALAALAWRGRDRTLRALAAALVLASLLQTAFWLCYMAFGFSPYRYMQPSLALLAPGLIVLAVTLFKRNSVLWIATLALIFWNVWNFLTGKEDVSGRAFFFDANTGVTSYVWYMRPFPPNVLESHGAYGTPMGLTQWLVLLFLLGAGSALLISATCRKPAPKSVPVNNENEV